MRLLIRGVLALALLLPIVLAATSPYLAWRSPVYIAAGFAGIVAMSLMVLQPLLAAGYLQGLATATARKVHRWIGAWLIAMVLLHVAGLWVTSPPDVIDALTFTSPTPFSHWGVIAMWALLVSGALALARKPLRLSPRLWRRVHTAFFVVIVSGTVAHVLLIEGTMETVSKTLLSLLLFATTAKAVLDLKVWVRRRGR